MQTTTVKSLKPNIKVNLVRLKKIYKNIIGSSIKKDNEHILFDNFYIIERMSRIILNENNKLVLPVDDNKIPLLGKLVTDNCKGPQIPDTPKLISIFSEEEKVRYISSTEYELLIFSMRYSWLCAFADIYLEKSKTPDIKALDLITLLTMSDTVDLPTIIKSCDPLEKLYSNELCGVYINMDEDTKKMYRTRTAALARLSGTSETDLAISFLKTANHAMGKNKSLKESHIGYYINNAYKNDTKRISFKNYLTFIIALSIALSAVFVILTQNIFLVLAAFLPIFEISRVIINILFTSSNEITFLPRMENNGHIDENNKTLIVISTLISTPKDIINLKKKLIKQYYLNYTENIKICALCDLKESDLPTSASDNLVKRNSKRMIDAINKKYNNSFIFVLRNRTFSQTQQIYTGFDRKRGAIEQLVRYIKNEDIIFYSVLGDNQFLKDVKYLICLDYDTKPLMDTVASLVAIATHPLNKSEIKNGHIVSGYGIIAPKITTKLDSSLASPFAKLAAGVGSSCAYDTLTSNLYQDTFDEGIFTGKGLIDVNAFYSVCCHFFPKEEILSHDILEGELMHTAYASDVVFSDSFPLRASGYFKRMHRWIRGDVQNIGYIFSKIKTSNGTIPSPFNGLSRYKLVDNIKRAVFPVHILLVIFLSFFISNKNTFILAFVAFLSIFLPYVISFGLSIINNGIYNIPRKFYSNIISQTSECICQGLFYFLILPLQALYSIDAIIKALYRKYISHKNLLLWTTSAQAESQHISSYNNIISLIFPNILTGIILLFTDVNIVKLVGLIYIFSPILLIHADTPYKFKNTVIKEDKKNELISQLSLMWQFYEDYCTAKDNYLPPDNVQFAPIFRVCHRTSPTNIGLMLLSVLAARDFDIINTNSMTEYIINTLSSIEKLEKYKGNLYNWYETKTLKLSNNPFVSTVDSGNFLCCLVALKSGLLEYRSEDERIPDLINRIVKIIDETDLSVFYNKRKKLFSIGINPNGDILSPNHYDLLMSEARMTSYFAIAKRIVSKSHWKALGRILARHGLYSGCISYSGTCFEFFMPELLLRSENGSLAYESLKFSLACQKKRGKDKKVPFGISESAYFAFDNALNYQYKAHGVQKTGLKKRLDNELVVSPYSSYLLLLYDFDHVYDNLSQLKKYGMMGRYGLYEAIDFTANKVSNEGFIIKSYMAHHIGMSIVAISNVLLERNMQKRFMKDEFMKSADELLSEKVMSNMSVFKDIYQKPETQRINLEENKNRLIAGINPVVPQIKLLSNREYTLALCDNGCSVAIYQNRDVYLRTTDLLRSPHGCYFAFSDENKIYPLSCLPIYCMKKQMKCEFKESSVIYTNEYPDLKLSMNIFLHQNLPCEIRTFKIKNNSSKNKTFSFAGYIEPVLATFDEYTAHPAFSKLFLKIEYDIESNVIFISRKMRHNDYKVYCAVGFIDNDELICNLSREDILSYPSDVKNVFEFINKFYQNYNSIPDPAIFIKNTFNLKANEEKELRLFILTALSKEELIQNISKIRHSNVKLLPAPTMIKSQSIEGRLVSTLLPRILFKTFDCKDIINSIQKNELDISYVWGLKISGCNPIIVVNVDNTANNERVDAYLNCHKYLKSCSINTELIFTVNENGSDNLYNYIFDRIIKCQTGNLYEINGGIFIINTAYIDKKVTNLIYALACHIAPQTMVRINTIARINFPVTINPVCRDSNIHESGFNKANYIINDNTLLPWCNILANPAFGCLVSNNSLGFTYAINSRENKLTAWDNDTRADNIGEMLILKADSKYYDLIKGSTVIYSKSKCVYHGETESFKSQVTVTVANKGMCKRISVKITPKKLFVCCVAYYTEPVLGVTRDKSSLLTFRQEDQTLFIKNPLNCGIKGVMALSTNNKTCHFTTNRDAFLSGVWDECLVKSTAYPCAALILNNKKCESNVLNFELFMSFGATEFSAKKITEIYNTHRYESYNSFTIKTPDERLNYMFNSWIMHQTVDGRIHARTGFYQNSGAWGFRDQLQDSIAALYVNPMITKTQIARCCFAQFEDGDVLHWWHKLSQKIMRGVRTRYSDDLVWLPYAVCQYIKKTDDMNILAMNIPYCEGITLSNDQHEIFGEVKASKTIESVYNHCKRALKKAFRLGSHNLILMGCGDWNDSFNGVGIGEKGESVWLSQFMIIVLNEFANVCKRIGDVAIEEEYIRNSRILAKAIDEHCWDGEWYIRAFFDNGDELGSRNSKACIIDSLAQSFAVLADINNDERNNIALCSAYDYLVDRKNSLIKLFTPPFVKNEMPVGYAASYPAGIRENGGQYTQGAIWLAMAYFKAGDTEKGFELLNILNPANKYLNEKNAMIFKNEPYFMTADIYTNPQCYGRGGWSIYTGAAAWFYRTILEGLCGIQIDNNKIYFRPHLPASWKSYEIDIKYNYTKLHVLILHGGHTAVYDNDTQVEFVELDKLSHEIKIIIAEK